MPEPKVAQKKQRVGGREKGTPNKKTAEFVAAIEASGLTPLQYMLGVVRDEYAPVARRDAMASAAAPYVHAKLASVEHAGPNGGPIPHEVTHITRKIVRPK